MKIKQVLYAAGLTIGFSLFLYQVVQGLRAAFSSQIELFSPSLLIASLGVLLTSICLQIVIFWLIMAELGHDLSVLQIARGYALSFIPRYIPGSVWGYLSRSEWLNRRHEVAYSVSNAASILEVFVALFAGMIGVSLYLLIGQLSGNAIVLLILIIILPFLTWAAFTKIVSLPALGGIIKRLSLTPLGVLRFSSWMGLLGIMMVQWLILGLAVLLIVAAFQTDPASLIDVPGLLNASAAYCIAWSVGFLVLFLPAGIGVRESVLVALLSTMFFIATGDAQIVAVILRLLYAAAELAWIGLGMLLSRSTNLSSILPE